MIRLENISSESIGAQKIDSVAGLLGPEEMYVGGKQAQEFVLVAAYKKPERNDLRLINGKRTPECDTVEFYLHSFCVEQDFAGSVLPGNEEVD